MAHGSTSTLERQLEDSFGRLIEEQEREIERDDNLTYESDEVIDIENVKVVAQNPNMEMNNESATLVRRRVRRAKDANRGIEDIVEEMPSRTIDRRSRRRSSYGSTKGRNHGRQVGAHVNSGTVHRHTIGRTRGGSRYGSMFRHQRLTSVDGSLDAVDVNDIYEDMKTESGDIDGDELRELPLNLTMKRQVRQQAAQHREAAKSKKIGTCSMWKYNISLSWSHFWDDTKKSISSAELWGHHLKEVEGHFGTGVLSFFTFLRAIFLLSIPSFLLNFCFITIPQVLQPPERPDDNITFTGEELLTGAMGKMKEIHLAIKNWLEYTLMYYGYYTNGTIERVQGVHYSMPMAYMLTTAGYFLMCLLWLVITTAKSFRRSYIDGKDEQSHFINKIFCNWDFGISSGTIAKLHHKTINTELKEILAERRRQSHSRTSCEKFELFLLRVFWWLLYFAIVGACLYLVFFVNQKLRNIENLIGHELLNQMSLAMVVSVINLLVPYVITALTQFEKYKYPRHELYINIIKNFLLKMGLIVIICSYWTIDSLEKFTRGSANTTVCWETNFGEEIYRLMIVDFIFSIIFATFCAEFLRSLMAKYCCTKCDQPEFTISNNVLDLIYGQTLCWVGVYFSPMLALINIIKYFLIFYIKKISVMQNCRPSDRRWRAAQSQTIFRTLLLISFIISAVFLCVVIFVESPSPSCGPFRDYSHAYDIIVQKFKEMNERNGISWLSTIIQIITSIWVLYAILIILIVLIHFAKASSQGHKLLSNKLRNQISLEGKDKALLLQWLQDVANRTLKSESRPRTTTTASQHCTPILHRKLTPNTSNVSRQSSNTSKATPQGRRRVFTSAAQPSSHRDPMLQKVKDKQQHPKSQDIELTPRDVENHQPSTSLMDNGHNQQNVNYMYDEGDF